MSQRICVITLTGCIAALAFATVIRAQQPALPAPVDALVLRNAGTPTDPLPGSWLSYGRSQSETRYSPLKTDRHLQHQRAWTRLVVRSRCRRWQSGRNLTPRLE